MAVAGEARDGLEALAAIRDLRPDVVLLDVQMPGLDGFEVLRALPAGGAPPLVVVVTAYEQHALAAFEVEAVSYLLKPVGRDPLARALARCRELARSRAIEEEFERLRRVLERVRPAPAQLVARTAHGFRLVPVEEVLYAEVESGLVHLHTPRESLPTDRTLDELARELPQPPFFLARRGVLVNLERVREIESYHRGTYVLILDTAARIEIVVSERRSKRLREWLQDQRGDRLAPDG